MVHPVPDILSRITASKRAALADASRNRAPLERRAADRPASRDFGKALTSARPAIIAEIKKASPSKGIFTNDFDPAGIARRYAGGGASALSVLTDADYFQGSLGDLAAAREAVSLPVLRKDFTIDELHVIEAAAHNADAILLIASILEAAEMRKFRELAAQFGMAALVEVHDEDELAAALDSGARIVGVNNRNLHTFETNTDTSLRLAEKIPGDVVRVSESGIDSREIVERLGAAGYHAFLVGEYLMKAADPEAALRALRS